MRLSQQVEHLEDLVDHVATLTVLLGLNDVLLQARFLRLSPARHLEHRAEHDLRVLDREQSGPVRRELGFALPLEQSDQDRASRQANDRETHRRQVEQDHRHRLVENVIAHDVTDLVADHVGELVVVEKPYRSRIQDDEGLLHPPSTCIDDRRL